MASQFRHSPEAFVFTGPTRTWRAFRSQATAFVFTTHLETKFRCIRHHIGKPSTNPFTALRTIWCRKKQEPETAKKTGGRCVAMCTSPKGLNCPLMNHTGQLQGNAFSTAEGLLLNDLAFPSSWFD